MILLSVSMILLLLRYNHISLHQSSNFIWFPSNHPGSGTMLFGMTVCIFLFASAGATDISVSVCLYSLKASSVICKDSSYSDNVSLLFVLLELVLVLLRSYYYMCFIRQVFCLISFVNSFHYTSLARWAHWYFTKCYDLCLELRLHLDKDLRIRKGWYRSGKV